MIAEELLHFIWQFRLFNQLELYSTDDEKIKIFEVGQSNKDAGPDFLFSQISIDGQEWRGHVEIHVEGIDWFKHGHQLDAAYNAVVLHVVFRNPVQVLREDGTSIPCLELGPFIDAKVPTHYRAIMENLHWIPCEKQLPHVPELSKIQMMQRMAAARLEQRHIQIHELLTDTFNDWERVLFLMLCRGFGMKVNAQPFLELGRLVDLMLIRKYRAEPFKIEAMIFGQAGFLADAPKEGYIKKLADEYLYLKSIHHLQERKVFEWKFMRMRPYNFPTFRLAQLSALYSRQPYLFEQVMHCREITDLYQLLIDVTPSSFWETHFVLGKTTISHTTQLSPSFIEHISINAFIPVIFSYGKYMGIDGLQAQALEWLEQLKGEKNKITRKFNELTLSASSAADSQGLLQLKKEYCDQKRCLECGIGLSIFKS